MEILISKLEKKGLLEDLKKKVGEHRRKKLNKKEFVPLFEIVKHISLDTIGYTFKDCLIDYHDKLEGQTEKEIVWKLWSKGYSPYIFERENNLSSCFSKYIKYGIKYDSEFTGQNQLMEFMELDLNLSRFKVVEYSSHIELFGKESELITFRDKYKLGYDVIWEKENKSYHLAFAGLLAEYIKKTRS